MMKSLFEIVKNARTTQSMDAPSYQSMKIGVRFKFRDSKDEYTVLVTHRQYENLKSIENLEYCKTVNDVKHN